MTCNIHENRPLLALTVVVAWLMLVMMLID